MKIVIVSDTHGDEEILENIFLANQDATYFFHLGDSELPKEYLSHYLFLKGNCDFFLDAPNSLDIEYPFGKVHMEHGNKINFHKFEDYVKSKECDYFFFGHTHVKYHEIIGNTHVFNPGSTRRPRDGNIGSYLILNFENNVLSNYKFVMLDKKN